MMIVKMVLRDSKQSLTNLSSQHTNSYQRPPLGALLRLTHELVYAELYAKTAAAGYPELRPAHFRLLRFPGVDGARPTELASGLDTSKQAINPLLNDLERWGYLERRTASEDARGRVLHLTGRGTKLMSTIRRLQRQIESRWAEQLGSRRFHAVLAALDQIARTHPAHPSQGDRNR
jgi:DNA-binding MarR family transcriptional regulator